MESCFSAPNNASSFINVNKSVCFIKHDTKLFTTNQLSMKLCKPKYFRNVFQLCHRNNNMYNLILAFFNLSFSILILLVQQYASNYNLLCKFDSFFIHIWVFYYSIFDLNYWLHYWICNYNFMKDVLLLHLFLLSN